MSDVVRCATCKWAEFERTAKGGIKRSQPGDCQYPVASIPLPVMPDAYVIRIRRVGAIWPDDGHTCQKWQPQPTGETR